MFRYSTRSPCQPPPSLLPIFIIFCTSWKGHPASLWHLLRPADSAPTNSQTDMSIHREVANKIRLTLLPFSPPPHLPSSTIISPLHKEHIANCIIVTGVMSAPQVGSGSRKMDWPNIYTHTDENSILVVHTESCRKKIEKINWKKTC